MGGRPVHKGECGPLPSFRRGMPSGVLWNTCLAARGRGVRAWPRMRLPMSLAALFTWIVTAAGGLYLLTIWLIEYDREFQSAAATRLPVPVISPHALLAVAGLVVWGVYLITDTPRLALAAAATLIVVAALGLTMAGRWFGGYPGHDSAAGP